MTNARINESTIARIAGNLMSGRPWVDPNLWQEAREEVRRAVSQARAIAAEVERTQPRLDDK